MNERLQKKIDELKKDRDAEYFHPLMCFDAHPPKMEYDMPAEYQHALAQFLKFIETRDSIVKNLKYLSESDNVKMRAELSAMNLALDKFETNLEQSYLAHQQKEQEKQELYEATDLQDQISVEHFIMVKHLKPHIFEQFKEFVFKYMTEAEIEEQLAEIARREALELEAILAADIQEDEFVNPHLKRLSPYDLFTAEMVNLMMLTLETDDFTREHYKLIEESRNKRFKLACRMYRALPVLRRRLDATIRELEPAIRTTMKEFMQYLEDNKASGKFTEIEYPDAEQANKSFERLENYQIEVFIANKHLEPEMFPEYERIVTDFMSPAEKEEYYARIAECEKKSLKIILKAVANEIY